MHSTINFIKASLLAACCLIMGSTFGQGLNPLNIGTLNAGDSVVVYYDVTINNPCGCMQVSNQGTVSGSNFTTFSTNDPDTGPDGDPTVTLLNMFPLPVTFYELKAVSRGTGIEVSWKVADESNIVKYEVERSSGVSGFTKIAEVQSLNSSVPLTYQFNDLQPYNGINFYRIRIVETVAAAKYSSVVRVDRRQVTGSITVYPNPVSHKTITLGLSNIAKGRYDMQLTNGLGQPVFRAVMEYDGGSVARSISIPPSIPAGTYFIRITNKEGLVHSQQLIIY